MLLANRYVLPKNVPELGAPSNSDCCIYSTRPQMHQREQQCSSSIRATFHFSRTVRSSHFALRRPAVPLFTCIQRQRLPDYTGHHLHFLLSRSPSFAISTLLYAGRYQSPLHLFDVCMHTLDRMLAYTPCA